jgi:hypothetical protein
VLHVSAQASQSFLHVGVVVEDSLTGQRHTFCVSYDDGSGLVRAARVALRSIVAAAPTEQPLPPCCSCCWLVTWRPHPSCRVLRSHVPFADSRYRLRLSQPP